MPKSTPRVCSRCNTIVKGRCPTCAVGWKTRPSKNWVPGTYNQKRWERTSNAFLQANPICADCGDLANEVDHIDGTDYSTQRYDWAQLRALCTPCHRKRTSKQGNDAQWGKGGQDHGVQSRKRTRR